MLLKILKSVIVAIVVTLACIFVALLLNMLHLEIATAVAGFLNTWGAAIGILSGIWYFASH